MNSRFCAKVPFEEKFWMHFIVRQWQALKCWWHALHCPKCHFSLTHNITMVSVSTVQPSLNLVFLCTDKNLKMPLYTLLKVSESTDFQIWKVMHEIIAEWWKKSCRTMGLPWYFLRVERPLWWVVQKMSIFPYFM